MLFEIIENIFTKNSFNGVKLNFDQWKTSIFKRVDLDEYYIVVDKEACSNDDLIELSNNGQELIYKTFVDSEFYNEAADKNTTLIICSNYSPSPEINTIEEDTYLFKKNILFYDENALLELYTLVNNDYSLKNLNVLLNDDNMFETAKTNGNKGYELLCKIFIKLSFLKYLRSNRELHDLSATILEKVEESNLLYIYDFICNSSTDVSAIFEYQDFVNFNLIAETERE